MRACQSESHGHVAATTAGTAEPGFTFFGTRALLSSAADAAKAVRGDCVSSIQLILIMYTSA